VAHDSKKDDLLAWAQHNRDTLAHHELYATGTTGKLIHEKLGLPITVFQSGPLGGDMQLGAKITEGLIDMMVFFWDPLEAQPHDPDVRALLRVTVVWNTLTACNPATADMLISSVLFNDPTYKPVRPDYSQHRNRPLPNVK
jgi:methylglyoxal synthase